MARQRDPADLDHAGVLKKPAAPSVADRFSLVKPASASVRKELQSFGTPRARRGVESSLPANAA